MQINIKTRERKIEQGSTFISPNLKKEIMMLDKYGNEIDPRTRQIIKRNNEKE